MVLHIIVQLIKCYVTIVTFMRRSEQVLAARAHLGRYMDDKGRVYTAYNDLLCENTAVCQPEATEMIYKLMCMQYRVKIEMTFKVSKQLYLLLQFLSDDFY